jgi:acylglycerol lipase
MSYSTSATSIRGLECHVHLWNVSPEETIPKALVVVFHGFLAHGNYPTVRYAAEFLATEEYAVVAVDFPGHGKSKGQRGYLESAETMVQDGACMIDYATALYKEKSLKLFLMGSSMGGAIALSVAQQSKSKDQVAGVLLLAPMLKLNVSSAEHFALKGLAFFVPTWQLIPSSATNSEKQYRDDEKRKECDDDKLTVSGAYLQPSSALACVDITHNIRSLFETIETPMLIMVADEDIVVKNEGSEELFSKSISSDKIKNHYPSLHGLLCEPNPLFDEIKSDILNWIKERL